MALEVRNLKGATLPAVLVADRRLYLTADRTTVVEEGDPRAAFLLAGQGSEIPAAEVERLGLTVDGERKDDAETEHNARSDDKARLAAPNKARRKGEDK